MKIEIKIPKMGESVTQATIGTIMKPSGSHVRADEEILELETEKVNQVIFAPSAGKIELKVKTGDTVKVDEVIGLIDADSKEEAQPLESSRKKQEAKPVASSEMKNEAKAAEPNRVKEKMAEQSNESAVQKLPSARKKGDDYIAELSGPPRAPAPAVTKIDRISSRETRKKMSKLRKVIAQRLVQVKNETAMLTTFNEVDMSAVMQIRAESQESFVKKHGVKLGFMSFFVKACVAALQEFPEINARIDGDEIVYHHFYDIGIAVGTEKGLFVPVIRNADTLSYAEIEKGLKIFADKARNGTISIDDMQGGTFTITNGGVYGSLLSTPILNPPQSGILGMHNIVKRAVVVNDEIVIRPMMNLALSYDHRIIDGKDSISFLMHIKKSLEEPARLMLDL